MLKIKLTLSSGAPDHEYVGVVYEAHEAEDYKDEEVPENFCWPDWQSTRHVSC